MAWTQESIEKTFLEVKKKAMVDKKFRELVLSDPNAAIKQIANQDVPEGFKIKVVENDPAYAATFVLPDLESEEISDEALGNVAGGISIVIGASLLAGACAAAISIGGCGAHACAADAKISFR